MGSIILFKFVNLSVIRPMLFSKFLLLSAAYRYVNKVSLPEQDLPELSWVVSDSMAFVCSAIDAWIWAVLSV